jgi:hypothetical protein
MSFTNDEQTPIAPGRWVHVVGHTGCLEVEVTDLHPHNSAAVYVEGITHAVYFDRAMEIVGTWHFADHGKWRQPTHTRRTYREIEDVQLPDDV